MKQKANGCYGYCLCLLLGYGFLYIYSRVTLNGSTTLENKHVMYAKGRRMSLILKNSGSLSLLFANQAFLHSVVDQSEAMPLIMTAILGMITVLYPVYFLVWSVLSQKKT